MPADQLAAVLPQYDLVFEPEIVAGDGSASPKVVIGQCPQRYLLKRRRAEFSAPEVVAFDHGIMQHLADVGLPVFPPLSTADGATAVWHDDWAFELFPFVEGLFPFPRDNRRLTVAAADLLGRVHTANENFSPPGRKDWCREFHMATVKPALEQELRRQPSCRPEEHRLAREMLRLAQDVETRLADDVCTRLPQTIVHGDYTWANLACRDAHIGALFDFDWTYRQAHLDDVARAVLFIAFPPATNPALTGNDIWSLTSPWRLDLDCARTFLAAYEQHHPFTDLEREMLPWYVREVWLCCRIRAMRKVPDADKLRILTFGMEPLLDCWDQLTDLGT